MENRQHVLRNSSLPVIVEVENDNAFDDDVAGKIPKQFRVVRFVNDGSDVGNSVGVQSGDSFSNNGGSSNNERKMQLPPTHNEVKVPLNIQPIQQVIFNSTFTELNNNGTTFGHQDQPHSGHNRQYHHRSVAPNGYELVRFLVFSALIKIYYV